jgi:hypothetical protein
MGRLPCVSGWTATVRRSSSYTSSLKVDQLAAFGYADQNPKDYEEDHRVPLELGERPTRHHEPQPRARGKSEPEGLGGERRARGGVWRPCDTATRAGRVHHGMACAVSGLPVMSLRRVR